MHKGLICGTACAFAVLATACGGSSGGGNTAIEGLQAPSQLQIVTASEGVAPAGSSTPGGSDVVTSAATDPGFAAGVDYYLDQTSVHVYDPAIEPLQLINQILCYMGQTGAGELVNEGAYIAQVDTASCEDGGNESAAGSEAGQSAGGGATELELWTVLSSRAGNSAPHEVHIWVPSDDEMTNETIFVDVSITESADDMDPFGQFAMNFAGSDTFANIGTPSFLGSLGTVETPSVGDIGFSFFEDQGDINSVPAPNSFSHRVQVNVEMTEDQSEGWAKILSSERYDFGGGDSGILTNAFDVAFDATHFLRSTDGGAGIPYERNEFDENVWRYGLYYADGVDAGSRVEVDSGFGFRTESGDYGWMGFYGAWVPEGVAVDHGDTVMRDVYSQQPSELVPYTVFKAPGKLIRFSQESLALTEIENQVFEWWTWDSMTQMSTIYRVQYFNGSGEWHKVAVVDPDSYQPTPLSPTEMIDTSVEGVLDMWADGLGGRVVFVDGQTEITFFQQDFVNADDAVFTGSTTLHLQGFTNCLESGILETDAENGDIFLADAPDVMTPHVHEFHQDDLTLYLDTDGMGTLGAVGLAPDAVPASGPNTWGMSTGPLVTADVAATLTSIYDVWTVSEFYVWETGHNDWNQFIGLIDSAGDFATFDPPLAFTYEHSTADDRNDDATYDGQTFFLQYHGPGDLSGLPHDGVDLDGDGNFDRYYPVVSLADGTALTDGSGTNYVIKAWEAEQVLTEDLAYAGTLDLSQTATLVLPDGSGYVTPTIGAEPVVPDAPRVVSGEVVLSD